MLDRHLSRRGEKGQALVLALAFIAFFGLVVGAIMNYAGVTGQQHAHTEATATSDSRVEGGAAYAAADANRVNLPAGQSLPAIDCLGQGNTGGSLTMADPAPHTTVTYSTQNCNPGTSSQGGGLPGNPCILCVLNDVATPFSKSAVVLTDSHTLAVAGDVDVNGSVASSGVPQELIQSTGYPPFFSPAVNIMGTCPAGACSPNPSTYSNPITNPLPICPGTSCLPGTLPAPTGLGAKTASCASPALTQGIYSGMTGNCTYTLAAGVYVFTGAISLSGNAQLNGTGVAIYLACSGFPTPCVAGGTGGSITTSGKATISATPPSSGTYSGISVYADPLLAGTLLNVVGNGDSIGGTVDIPNGDVNIGGGGTGNGVTISGRLIANTVLSKDNGKVGSGLTLDGGLFGPKITSSCSVFDDTVAGAKGTATASGRAIVQERCPGTGLVDMNYSP